MGINPNWSSSEIEYLSEQWGTKSVLALSKQLGRSPVAIKAKARKLKLGSFLNAGDYVSLNQLYATLGIVGGGEWRNKNWISQYNFPVRYRRVEQKRFRVVYIKDFWEWAFSHQSKIDFTKFEENSLGEEPEWAKQKRKADFEKLFAVSKSATSMKWTPTEDEKLLFMLKTYKYTAEEIAKSLLRSESAVIRRISTLKIPYRPLRNDSHGTPWTEAEKSAVITMIKGNSNYPAISKAMDRHSEKAIRGLVYRLYGTENLDVVRTRIA